MLRRSHSYPASDPPGILPLTENDWVKRRKKRQKLPLTKQTIGATSFVFWKIHDFLHARTGPHGCRLAGYIRITYALLFLYSRFLFAMELPFLFDPNTGVMPYRATEHQLEDTDWSVFQLAPDSSAVVYLLFFAGLVHGVLLLLGIAPRIQVLGVFFFLCNLHSHNKTLYDHQEVMLRLWSFMLLWLPLDHISVKDNFGGLLKGDKPSNQQLSTSWPMWPFRLWQVYTCLVYTGAGLGKLNTEVWQDGTALYYSWYEESFCRFFPSIIIELFFNRMWAIKLATWGSLVIECLCFITIWPLATRRETFVAIVLLHIGIDLAMIMHIFEYLSVLGWVVFFVQPNDGRNDSQLVDNDDKKAAASKHATSTSGHRKLLHSVVAVSLLYAFVVDTLPTSEIVQLSPFMFRPLLRRLIVRPIDKGERRITRYMDLAGLHAGQWTLFGGIPPHSNAHLTAVINFRNGTSPVFWEAPKWSEYSLYERERYYWSDTYYYYLLEDGDLSFFATLAKNLAIKYSNGGITFENGEMLIQPINSVSSVSFKGHWQTGVDTTDRVGLFQSLPRRYTTSSECQYVLRLNHVQNGVGRVSLYGENEGDDDGYYGKGNKKDSGCSRYDKADDTLHRRGKFSRKTKGGRDERVDNLSLKTRDRQEESDEY